MTFTKYDSRFKAGQILAEFIDKKNEQLIKFILKEPTECFCFAIPNGGVPVTEGFCSKLNLKYDILIVRKIKIPYNTEAGFGSVTTDGTVLINEPLLSQLNLSEKAVQDSINISREEIKERLEFYRKNFGLEDFYKKHIHKKLIFILDDGLASGFTMLAAISMIRNYKPKQIIIAVPTAPLRTVKRVEKEVDEIFCPNIRTTLWFAVADAYKNWYDVPESEVLEIINNSDHYVLNI